MLRIKTKIGPSRIQGMGLFADQFVPKGTVTWQYDPGLDVGITAKQLEDLFPLARSFLLHYCYYDKGKKLFVLPSDNLRFINHSQSESDRNITSTPDQDIASRDIQPGEELLCDYNQFDDEYFQRHDLQEGDLR